MQATYPIDNFSLVHVTATKTNRKLAKLANLLQLELHKLATKQEQQQAK
jgi:hypothetical protein